MEVLPTLIQVFAAFAIVLLASVVMKRQKQNDNPLHPIPIRVHVQRRIRR